MKTSITLSEDVLRRVDELAGQARQRFDFIETALLTYLAQTERAAQNLRDLEIINRRAGRLNREAEEVQGVQTE